MADEDTKKRKRRAPDAAEDPQLARARLELEQQRLELERQRLELEQQKLAVEARRAKPAPTAPPGPARAGASSSGGGRKAGTGRGMAVASVLGALAAAGTVFGAIHMLNTGRAGSTGSAVAASAPAPAGPGVAVDEDATDGPGRVPPPPEVDVVQRRPTALPTADEVFERERERERQQAALDRMHRAELEAEVDRIKAELPEAAPAAFAARLERLRHIEADRAADEGLKQKVRAARDVAELYRPLAATRGIADARRLADGGRLVEALAALAEAEQLGPALPQDALDDRARWQAAVAPTPAPPAPRVPPVPPPTDGPYADASAGQGPSGREPAAAGAVPASAPAEVADDADPEADALEGAPAAPAAPAATPEQLAEIEQAVRERTADWLKLRTLRALRCYKCDGQRLISCAGCGGDGITTIIGVNGTYQESCNQCRRSGRVPCDDSLCVRGLRSLSLKKAFWDFMSPAWRKGRKHAELYRGLVEGRMLDVIGPAILLKTSKIERVQVRERDVVVIVAAQWDFYTSELDELAREQVPLRFVARWIRSKGKFWLGSGTDADAEQLR